MIDGTKHFQQQTINALNSCADYLRDNAEELAKRFSDSKHGCKRWSIEFRADADGIFPWVEVHESVDTIGVIKAYRSEGIKEDVNAINVNADGQNTSDGETSS